jgi:hypothetical protein
LETNQLIKKQLFGERTKNIVFNKMQKDRGVAGEGTPKDSLSKQKLSSSVPQLNDNDNSLKTFIH